MSASEPTENPNRLLTAKDVAERWQVSPAHVYGLARAGKIPTVAIGRYYRFRLDALIEWEQQGGTQSSSSDRRARA
jgi:excisionase family DNA binding protein